MKEHAHPVLEHAVEHVLAHHRGPAAAAAAQAAAARTPAEDLHRSLPGDRRRGHGLPVGGAAAALALVASTASTAAATTIAAAQGMGGGVSLVLFGVVVPDKLEEPHLALLGAHSEVPLRRVKPHAQHLRSTWAEKGGAGGTGAKREAVGQ